MAGGIGKVTEINRNFRNDAGDSSHSPEFAMLEYDSTAVLTREPAPVVALAEGLPHDLCGLTSTGHPGGTW